jgi:hypothetical protein
MHARGMFRFKDCRFARMSSGRYCLIRDLGLVKGGKGLRHHEVLIAFSLQAALQRIRRAALERFNRAPAQTPDVGLNFRPELLTASADDASLMKPAVARLSSRSLIGEAGARNSPISKPQSISS